MLLEELLCGPTKNNPSSLIVEKCSRGAFKDTDMVPKTLEDYGIKEASEGAANLRWLILEGNVTEIAGKGCRLKTHHLSRRQLTM